MARTDNTQNACYVSQSSLSLVHRAGHLRSLDAFTCYVSCYIYLNLMSRSRLQRAQVKDARVGLKAFLPAVRLRPSFSSYKLCWMLWIAI